MAIIRWDPFTALSRLDTDFDELVRRAWGAGTGSTASSGFVPAVEMSRDGHDVLITVELPGVRVPDDVSIEVSEGRLVVSGVRQESSEQAADRMIVRELRYGSFRREFALPEHVGADDVDAGYDRGLLQIRVRNVSRPAAAPTKVPISTVEGPTTVQTSIESPPTQAE